MGYVKLSHVVHLPVCLFFSFPAVKGILKPIWYEWSTLEHIKWILFWTAYV
jgi:hypothetical protein